MSEPKVAIVGLGLIGSSLGLALRKAQPEFKIVGHDKDSALAKKAYDAGAVEKWERNLISAVEEAELVVISTSVPDVRKVLEATGPYLSANCVVTDTSTIKAQVMSWADELLPETAHFVGGHPMVRLQNQESAAADPELFVGATYCIVPSPKAHPAAIELVTSMARTVGAEPFFLDASEHDGQVAGVEHLPMLLSAALLLSTTQAPSWRDLRRLPGEVFWRATEFPSSDPEMNREVSFANRENISRWIDAYIDSLKELQARLGEADEETWGALIESLMDTRSRWMRGRATPEEEASSRDMEDLRSMTSLGSMLGLNQFRDLKKRMDDRKR
ncbi:MAG: prephenate dehydrogenase/arogenate dehydrogenase family protein [Anaerolineae bacterium]|nr:prephenate dehydrogenase/arogenate dehydrogenase family protein [Anaerolineae bacterium]